MAQAYSAGLTVTENTTLKKERILPLKGEVLVKKGDKVKADDLVARTMLPGKVVPLNLANVLGVTSNMVHNYLKVKEGEKITKGQILAQTNGIFGLFKNTVKSPTDGEVETISSHTGQMLLREPRIPIELKAFIDGIIVDVIPNEGVVIENKSAYIQGIFGLSGETLGEIMMLVNSPDEILHADKITPAVKGKIIVAGSMVDLPCIKKAREMGAHAIITGGIDDQDIKELLGYDIGVAITGHEKIGLTIVVTEGFGKITMAQQTFDLLKRFNGAKCSVHGKTQIRAGVMRPEIIIPIPFNENELSATDAKMSILEPGCTIRVIRQPNFGRIGKVTALPEQPLIVESETKVRILKARFENGEEVTIPRANVEVIEA